MLKSYWLKKPISTQPLPIKKPKMLGILPELPKIPDNIPPNRAESKIINTENIFAGEAESTVKSLSDINISDTDIIAEHILTEDIFENGFVELSSGIAQAKK